MSVLKTLKQFKPGRAQLIGGALILSSGMLALAAVPFPSFTAGTPISAAQVNANFSDADGRITTLEGVNVAPRLGTIETTVTGGNIVLANSTPTSGNIVKGANRFLHNFGFGNTFLGELAGNFTLINANNNTATGFLALNAITDGDDNVAMGLNALRSNTTGNSNTGLGVSAMFATNSGGGNVAVGAFALESNVSGGSNTVLGYGAGRVISGSNNIAVGVNAGSALTTGNDNIVIGHVGVAGNVGTIRIGTPGAQLNAFIAGVRGVTTTAADAIPVMISTTGQLGTVSSSRRVKDDIADMGEASSTLMKLRPVTFHYKSDQNPEGRALQYGLIAEEVEKVAPGLVARNARGEIETVYYQHLTPMLLNEYQKQQRVIGAQTERLAALEVQAREIVALKQQLAKVTAALARLEQPEKIARAGR